MVEARRITSKDVAQRAGVAQATVSYVLNGKGSISTATRNHVMRVATELGYRPNLAARSMRTHQSGRLAVVTGVYDFNSADIITGAAEVAEQNGYFLEVHSYSGSAENQSQQILELARTKQVEGILCFALVLDEVMAQMPADFPMILPDNYAYGMHSAGALADATPVIVLMEKLAALGHKRFLHVAGSEKFATAVARQEAYLATIERLNLESLGVIAGDWSAESGMAAIAELPDDAPPIAVIAANDRVAVGVMRAAALRGWRIPDDLSVTGWDNYDVSAFLTPPLTTVSFDRIEAGRREMRRLIALMRQEQPPPEHAPLHSIVWRDSTAAPTA